MLKLNDGSPCTTMCLLGQLPSEDLGLLIFLGPPKGGHEATQSSQNQTGRFGVMKFNEYLVHTYAMKSNSCKRSFFVSQNHSKTNSWGAYYTLNPIQIWGINWDVLPAESESFMVKGSPTKIWSSCWWLASWLGTQMYEHHWFERFESTQIVLNTSRFLLSRLYHHPIPQFPALLSFSDRPHSNLGFPTSAGVPMERRRASN